MAAIIDEQSSEVGERGDRGVAKAFVHSQRGHTANAIREVHVRLAVRGQ